MQSLAVRDAKHDRVWCMTFVPEHLTEGYMHMWWSAGARVQDPIQPVQELILEPVQCSLQATCWSFGPMRTTALRVGS